MDRQERIDRAWLRAALAFAMTMSKDPERKVGAAAVDSTNRLVSMGYNGFPTGFPDTPENWADKDLKNAIVQHAELNAIVKAPFSLIGGTCYVTLKPCHTCLAQVANAGIHRVVWLWDGVPWKYMDELKFNIVRDECMIQTVEYSQSNVELSMIAACSYWNGERRSISPE